MFSASPPPPPPEFVCPLLGYMEFLHHDWLTQILSWQHPSGCYDSKPKSVLASYYHTEDYDYNGKTRPERDDRHGNPPRDAQLYNKAVIQQTGDRLVLYNGGHKQKNDSYVHRAPGLDTEDRGSRARKTFNVGKNKPDLSSLLHTRNGFVRDGSKGSDNNKASLQQQRDVVKRLQKSEWTRRKLLVEKSLKGKC